MAGFTLEWETFDCSLGAGLTITNRSARLAALEPLLSHSDYGTRIEPAHAEELLEWNRSISRGGALEIRSHWHAGLGVYRKLVNDSLHAVSITLPMRTE